MGKIFYQQNKLGLAIEHWAKAVALKPDDVSAGNNLAWVLATVKDEELFNPTEALRLAEKVCELTGFQRADILDTLGVAYAAAGRFTDAVETTEKALELAQAANNESVAKDIRSHLRLYRENRPYRD